MKVKLINVADYELNEEKASKIPFETFTKMCATESGTDKKLKESDIKALPNVRLFKTIDDFRDECRIVNDFDETHDILILSNGNILVTLKTAIF